MKTKYTTNQLKSSKIIKMLALLRLLNDKCYILFIYWSFTAKTLCKQMIIWSFLILFKTCTVTIQTFYANKLWNSTTRSSFLFQNFRWNWAFLFWPNIIPLRCYFNFSTVSDRSFYEIIESQEEEEYYSGINDIPEYSVIICHLVPYD